MSTLNNLAITTTNRLMTSAIGKTFDKLQSVIANGGRDSNCKFYYNDGAGGSILQVVAKSVVGGAVADLKDVAVNAFNSLLNGKTKDDQKTGYTWVQNAQNNQKTEWGTQKYGQMKVNNEQDTVYALDDWGITCTDALMLGILVDTPVHISQTWPNFRYNSPIKVDKETGAKSYQDATGNTDNRDTIVNDIEKSDTLVWYDTTALITINSDKNLITTKVAGRDYSRKELVSNGDIKFSVSGQITSGRPDEYPAAEVQKFIKIMQYKGIIKVNNQLLDQFGISNIVITDFSLTPKEGYKSTQTYSFSALGLQPKTEKEIKDDTVTVTAQSAMPAESDDSAWMSMLKNQLEGLKSMASDLVSQGAGLASGMLEDVL